MQLILRDTKTFKIEHPPLTGFFLDWAFQTALFSTIGGLGAPVFYRLWRQNPSHLLCGWSLARQDFGKTCQGFVEIDIHIIGFQLKNRLPSFISSLDPSFHGFSAEFRFATAIH